MKLYELSHLTIKERFSFVNEFRKNNTIIPSDINLVYEIFQTTINWFKNSTAYKNLDVIVILKNSNGELPDIFEIIYEINEKSIIQNLSSTERLRIFNESKEGWKELYPDFKRISNIMENYKTNEMLVEFGKKSPPAFIHEVAINTYKKSISFKVKFTKRIMSHLIQNPNTLHIHYFPSSRAYCINVDVVKAFLKEFQEWNLKLCNLWNTIYSLKDNFYSHAAYENWKWYIKHYDLLKGKADEIQNIQDNAFTLLNQGKEIVLKNDEAITLEYNSNAIEMSLYERELEILETSDFESAADEEYCYVYTLECELFVFYVGIAADPKERFEQHIRGAFSDESHLFKSKFIQKYHNDVKHNIIFEGTRRECRKFERDYIAQFSPLGNMTTGGEG